MSLPLQLLPDRPSPGVRDATHPVAHSWTERLGELVRLLLPVMRRRAPHLPEPALLAAVDRIAGQLLADEELAQRSW